MVRFIGYGEVKCLTTTAQSLGLGEQKSTITMSPTISKVL